MKPKNSTSLSLNKLLLIISTCIAALFCVLHFLNYLPKAFAGDATSFNPTSVAVQAQGTDSGVPIGTVMPWPSSSIPAGWLECNGQSTSGYPELNALVGSTVPDLRGRFIRGHDAGKGIDPGRALLSSQNHAMKSHTHTTTISISGSVPLPLASGHNSWGFQTSAGYSAYSLPFSGSGSGVSTPAGSGTETRPVNLALKYIIKAE